MDPLAGIGLRTEARWRGAMRGPRGCVAADHPVAVEAGVAMLRAGGSAADAAVAMAAVMTVVQPHYSHLGGDLFALTYDAQTRTVAALNSSGPAPAAATAARYRALGAIPETGAAAVTVPGCVDGWWQLNQRYGRMGMDALLEPALELAKDGFPASRQLVEEIDGGRAKCQPAEFFAKTFGHVRRAGQRVVQPALARTLSAISIHGADAFYSGAIADTCREALAAGGVAFSAGEWRGPARWERPVSGMFAGCRLHTQPLPSQGFVLARALQRYEALLEASPDAAPSVLQHAALAEAFMVRDAMGGDPLFSGIDSQALADGPAWPSGISTRASGSGDTTYLLAIDAEGNAVSLIQSVFAHWGSGLWAAEVGVLFNNRMCGFTLEEGHPNELAPGKRPLHTLHCYMVTGADGALRAVGGTPGAMQQPQTNVQVLDHVLREGMDPQDALDLPRWSLGSFSAHAQDFRKVTVEAHEPDELSAQFAAAGIATERVPAWSAAMGRAFMTVVDEQGVAAAADLRGEGTAVVF